MFEDIKERIANKIITAYRIRSGANPQRARTRAEAESNWRSWATSCFPNYIRGEFAPFHCDMWDWGWSIKAGESKRPFVGLWFRHGAKCLDASTEILCADGLYRTIQDIQVGQQIFSVNESTGQTEIDTISKKFEPGQKECIRIHTRSGKSVVLTPDHKVLTFEGWKRAGDLTLTDRIASPRKCSVEPYSDHSDEEVRFLAYMLAEGTTTSKSIKFTNTDSVIVDDFKNCADRLGFGVSGPYGKCGYNVLKSRKWIESQGMFGKYSYEKRIPDWVFGLPERQKWMFLAAFIDTDGYVTKERGRIGITLASEGMIHDLGRLWTQVGVVNIFSKRSEHKHGAWQVHVDQEYLTLCVDNLPLRLKMPPLVNALRVKRYSQTDSYPHFIKSWKIAGERTFRAKGMSTSNHFTYDMTREKLRRMIDHDPVPRWIALEESQVFWDKIKSIEEAGERITYDVEVQNNHNLITGGLVTHNSSTVQMLLTCLGAMRKRKYCWYVSGTQEQADTHVQAVGAMLTASRIEEYYPDLATRKTDKYGTSAGWRRNRFWTQSGFTIDALGLDTASRGMKIEEQRPDILVIDDIDSQKDSPNVVANKIETLTSSIIPSGADDLIIIFVQNLIHRDSIASQLADGRAQFMMNRIVSGPIPALEGFEYETNEDGTWRISKGEPTWAWFDRAKCEKKLNDMGPAAFLKECQHVVDRPLPGALFREFNEAYHVITDSEFIEGYRKLGVLVRRDSNGRAIMPDRFNIGRAEDVGTTVKHPNVTTWVARPSQVHPLKECVFIHRELVFPEWAKTLVEPEPVSIKRISEEIHRLELLAEERYYINDQQLEDLKRRGLDEYIQWVKIPSEKKDVPIYSRIKRALISHEASSEVNTFNMDLPERLRLDWEKWDTSQGWFGGIAQIQNYMEIRPGISHPFRNYPEGHPQAGQPLEGCPRYFLVVADGQGELYWADNRLKVKAAINAAGLQRGRWEIPKYRLPENTQGVEQAKPLKIDDDWVDTQRALALDFFPPSGPLSKEEKLQKELPKTLQTAEIVTQGYTEAEQGMAWLAQQQFINQHGLQGKKKRTGKDRIGRYLMR